MKQKVRVASVQMALLHTPDDAHFLDRIAHFVATASDYGADFVCFPEHFSLQILSAQKIKLVPEDAIEKLTAFKPVLKEALSVMAVENDINIIGGSHAATDEQGVVRNICYVARRDGSLAEQTKIHPTPDEREVWKIQGGNTLDAIETDCGPVGVQICYDSEFPELGRRHADQRANIVFVPYCTDTRHGHLRVRYCTQARTVENQCYMVTAGLAGNIANVTNLEMAYAQSGIFTPSDHGFARDGIAAEATENIEQMIFADLDIAALQQARANGSVRNLADRRIDLYNVKWQP